MILVSEASLVIAETALQPIQELNSKTEPRISLAQFETQKT